MANQVLQSLVTDHSVIAEEGPKLLEQFKGLTCVDAEEQPELVLPDGTKIAFAEITLNDSVGAKRRVRGLVDGRDFGFIFAPSDGPAPTVSLIARPSAPVAKSVIGRWTPTHVEYFAVEEDEDDGGFSDEGWGETMDAADLLDKKDHAEFFEDGTFKGCHWGSDETGTWTIEGNHVVVSIYNTPTKWNVSATNIFRPDSDEEHGRDYEVGYKRA